MAGMDVELLVVPGCPNQSAAEELLRIALSDTGLPTDFRVVTITAAETSGDFAGSPTFCADGVDLFPVVGKSTGLSCRLYRSGSVLSGLPDLSALRQALEHCADSA